ncbi:hypothetical protein M758_1G243500 [Ceratodon purpureus]|nr:hypothetical protein M758_1G243500 [Ceratodon purpureus]
MGSSLGSQTKMALVPEIPEDYHGELFRPCRESYEGLLHLSSSSLSGSANSQSRCHSHRIQSQIALGSHSKFVRFTTLSFLI